MSLRQQLMDDMKQAMRSGEKEKLDTIRFLMAKVKNVEIDQGELDDDKIQQLVSKQIKEMKESFSDYEKAGRTELIDADKARIAVLEAYLPEQLSDAELDALIEAAIKENPDAIMGKIIGAVNQKAAGRAEGGVIAQKVKARMQ